MLRTSRRSVRHQCFQQRRSDGFTLIELLVCLAVIGILVALLLPAVMSARESARRTECRNHLKQIGLAFQQHEVAHGHFPSNGWGYLWIGEPDRGVGRNQPGGGWIYHILPYLEQRSLRELGKGQPDSQRRISLSTLSQSLLATLSCPSRPGGETLPRNPVLAPHNAESIESAAKTDYAVNEGDFITDTGQGPATLREGDSTTYPWKDLRQATGISYRRSEVKPRDATDGLSNTYLGGEKYVSRQHYETFDDPGYDQSMYSGVDLDLSRWVLAPPRSDDDDIDPRRFGSAHFGGCHMAFCDGSVKFIGENVNPEVHRHLGNRNDGEVVGSNDY